MTGSSLISVMKLGIRSETDESHIDSITLFVALLCACILIGHLFEKNRWLNESIAALFIGLCTGFIILLSTQGKSSHLFLFNEELFFIYVLPPIIFNAGFQVKKKQFFRNFLTIMLFGVVGTLISFIVISLGSVQLFKTLGIDFLDTVDYLALGAIFSATDSVCTLQVLNQEETPLLYSLVFGEGVVNDATSVVLFNAIQRFDLSHITSSIAMKLFGDFLYLFVTSTLLGVAVGLVCAFIIKKLYFGRHSTDREVSLMILMAYLSYIMAELFDLSAILTIFFCGIVMSHYTWHNVTESSRITTRHAFATLSFIAEIFIFLYVGMDALDLEKWKFVSRSPGTSLGASSILLGLVLVGRAAFIFPLSFVSNLTRNSPSDRIGAKQQVVIWWAGLMRGAVSMALAYNKFTKSGHTQLPGNAILITSTITVVLFSTVPFGLFFSALMQKSADIPFQRHIITLASRSPRDGGYLNSLAGARVFGLMTQPLIRLLLPIKRSSGLLPSDIANFTDFKALSSPLLSNGGEKNQGNDMGGDNIPRPTSLRMLLTTPTNTVHYYWRKFDDSIMRPVFGGRGFVPYVPGSSTEQTRG